MTAPGRQLLHYRIVDKLGEGGMGVVWRAHDTTLDREVAIKILPAAVADDSERLARFQNEARSLAALNHPNIATIHGLEQAEGVRFLVMELVAGEDLAERLERGALPVEGALAVAVQLAEALEAAHEQGIIHRDLKPANIKISDENKIKVLDFGLAKAFDPGGSQSGSPSMSPTLTSAGTAAGVILGTAAYMSPEQAKGKPVDRRADIWAFGVVLYEMLTGKALFRGDSVSETLAAVLMGEPDKEALPANTPLRVRRLLERCLRKEPQSRLRDIGDARLVLEEALAGREWTHAALSGEPGGRRFPWWAAGLLLVVGLTAGALIGSRFSRGAAVGPRVARSVSIVTDVGANPWPRVTPDGHALVYRGDAGLYVRDLAGYEERPIGGSSEIDGWAISPDSRWLAFTRGRTVSKVPLDGSAPPLELGEFPRNPRSDIVWMPGGRIVAVTRQPFIAMTVPTDGGPASTVEIQSGELGRNFFFVWNPLPDGRHVLGAADTFGADRWRMNVVALDVDSGETKLLVEDAVTSAYSPTGHLLFTRKGTLLAVPFDVERLAVTGGAVALREGLRYPGPIVSGFFSVSNDGMLVHRTGGGEFFEQLVVGGSEEDLTVWAEERRDFVRHIAVSPDGRRLAAQVGNWDEGLEEIWVSELDRPRLRPWIDVEGQDCGGPVWSADGETLYYTCGAGDDAGGLYRRHLSGTDEPELLIERASAESRYYPRSIAADGSRLLLARTGDGGGAYLLELDAATSGAHEPRLILGEGLDFFYAGRLSPDGRLLAYHGRDTGQTEVYLRRLSAAGNLGPPLLVSTEGGSAPCWASTRPGEPMRLLYSLAGGFVSGVRGALMEVDVNGVDPLRVSEPRERLDLERIRANLVEPLPGDRFLIAQREEAELEKAVRIRVVFDWFSELERLTAGGR